MRYELSSSLSVRRCLSLAFVMIVVRVFSAAPLTAQTAETLAEVRRVALEWPGTDRGSTAVRDRVLQKLKSSPAVEVVSRDARPDAVLHGEATIWVIGYTSPNPKSKSAEQAIYRGFASLEVMGVDGKALWSHLVTPRLLGWRSITDDLADQLVHSFLEALGNKSAGEKTVGGSTSGAVSAGATKITLRGAGATFPAPMYQKWFESFTLTRPEIAIQYSAVGSAEGIQRLQTEQVDFGATDMPLSEKQLNAPNRSLLQIATMVGAVVPIYNVTGAPEGLNLTPEVLAGIFLGKIQRWNAQEIHSINKDAHLPDQAIQVIHRSDGSGTTFTWTDYLSKVSSDWKAGVGSGTTVNWPVGRGAEHNDGVAEVVRKTANSIGYVEFIYALQHELDFAAVRNASGIFVKADLDSVIAAAKTAVLPENGGFGFSITNASGKHVYPIATFTWLLVPVEGRDAGKTLTLRDLLRWMLTNGQRQCEGLGYAPLPAELSSRELQALAALH